MSEIYEVARVTMTPLAYRVEDAAKMIGLHRTTIFKMIREGDIKARKIGAATVIPHSELDRIIQEAEETEATKRATKREGNI